MQYMPNAVLASVVFVIGFKMVDLAGMAAIARVRRDEFLIAAFTAAVVIGVGVEQAIILAIVLSVLDHVHRHYSPKDAVITSTDDGRRIPTTPTPEVRTEPGLVVYDFGVGLFYANATRLSTAVLMLVDAPDPPRWFVLSADTVDDVDFTAGQTLVELAHQLRQRNIVFAVAEPRPAVRAQLDQFGLTDAIGPDHFYATLDAAIAAFHAS
jgi:MFS superfamily sulfate permease-like transporter